MVSTSVRLWGCPCWTYPWLHLTGRWCNCWHQMLYVGVPQCMHITCILMSCICSNKVLDWAPLWAPGYWYYPIKPAHPCKWLSVLCCWSCYNIVASLLIVYMNRMVFRMKIRPIICTLFPNEIKLFLSFPAFQPIESQIITFCPLRDHCFVD